MRSPEAETPLVRDPLLKLPREEPPGPGGPPQAKAEKVRKLDPARACLPGTGLDQLPLLPLMLRCDDQTELPSVLTSPITYVSPWVSSFARSTLRRDSKSGSLQ